MTRNTSPQVGFTPVPPTALQIGDVVCSGFGRERREWIVCAVRDDGREPFDPPMARAQIVTVSGRGLGAARFRWLGVAGLAPRGYCDGLNPRFPHALRFQFVRRPDLS